MMVESIAVIQMWGIKISRLCGAGQGVLFRKWICAGTKFLKNGISRKQKKDSQTCSL